MSELAHKEFEALYGALLGAVPALGASLAEVAAARAAQDPPDAEVAASAASLRAWADAHAPLLGATAARLLARAAAYLGDAPALRRALASHPGVADWELAAFAIRAGWPRTSLAVTEHLLARRRGGGARRGERDSVSRQ